LLLLMQEGEHAMVAVVVSTRDGVGVGVVVLRRKPDVVDAAQVVASLTAVATSARDVIVGLPQHQVLLMMANYPATRRLRGPFLRR
jgi:hypothetical protein